MITVKLIAETKLTEEVVGIKKDEVLALASHAAKECYRSDAAVMGDMLDVENQLFKTSHHTTVTHPVFTFNVEGIAVSDITFGAHLGFPFYNSDQRSGRYCAKMFLEPDFPAIEAYIKKLWPELSKASLRKVMDFVKKGVAIYRANIEAATKIASEIILKERPFASKLIKNNAGKIAQEQLRTFISTIFPTGFDYTVDFLSVLSLYKAAWTPGLMDLTQKIADIILERHPEVAFVFSRRNKAWAPKILSSKGKIKVKPVLLLKGLNHGKEIVMPDLVDMYPVDLLHFLPEYMDNNINDVQTEVEISIACMGQDQRHRTIRRGTPELTGNFYLPPVIELLPKAKKMAKDYLALWHEIAKIIPETLAVAIAPYGTMVKYDKQSSFNALIHEQGKRLCWCAQEEIYHLGRSLRIGIESIKGEKAPLLNILEPPCFKNGVCAEGQRYCGRDRRLRKSGDYFPERKV